MHRILRSNPSFDYDKYALSEDLKSTSELLVITLLILFIYFFEMKERFLY